MEKKKSNLLNDDILNPLIGLAKASDLDSSVNPAKQKRKYIKKNFTSKSKSTGQLKKSKPKEKELNSEMYVDFPRNSNDKPSKITQIIKFMGFLSVLVPNRDLLRSFWGLIKAFISVAFTLSAIYAACLIYFNVMEWILYYLKAAFKYLLVTLQSYLPELFRFEIVKKALALTIGDSVILTAPRYIPDFLYKIWLYMSDRFFLRIILWLFVVTVIILVLRRFALFVKAFIDYAKTLPGTWIEKILQASKDYLVHFYERFKDLFLTVLSLFKGGIRPGTGWLNLLWLFSTAAEKRNNDEILEIWRKVTKPAIRLKIIVEELEELHLAKNEYVIDTKISNNLLNKGRGLRQEFNRRISILKMKMAETKDLHEATVINDILKREESHFKEVHNEFKLMLGFFGQPTTYQSSAYEPVASLPASSPGTSSPGSPGSLNMNDPDIFMDKNTGVFNDPEEDKREKK